MAEKIPYKHNLYRNTPVPDFVTAERYAELESSHKTREGDVFIATFMKSGTTWLQYILNELYCRPQGDKDNVNLAVPWIQEATQSYVDAMNSPRIFKTHDPWDWILKDPRLKYIYCYRNPKDVCCSYYNHMCNVFIGHYNYSKTMSEFFEEVFIKGFTEEGDYWEHLSGWFEQKGNPQILFITYEDMVEDLGSVILKIVNFLGLECSDSKIDEVVASSMFDVLSKNKKANYEWRDGATKAEDSKFMRKGKVGSWKDELTAGQAERIDLKTKEKLEIPFSIKIRDSLV